MAPPDQNIIRLFIGAAQRYPDRVAFIEGSHRLTFRNLLRRVRQTAAWYQGKGLKSGDPVLVFVPVSINLYCTVLALLYAGAVPVFLDEWASLARVKQCCAVVQPKAIVAPRRFLWPASILKPFLAIPLKLSAASPQHTTLPLTAPETKAGSEAALITFTTGTTGLPKAAVRTHAILHAQFQALTPLLVPNASVSLTLLPVVVLLHIGLGNTTVLSPVNPKNYEPKDARRLWQLSQRSGVTSLIASPFIVLELARYCKNHSLKSGIIEVITGGGPVFPEEAAWVAEAFEGAAVTIVYGSTEAEPISHLQVLELRNFKASVAEAGLPVGGVDAAASVAVVPFRDAAYAPMTLEQWQQLQLPANHIGEIVVSGPHVVRHYVSNQKEERLQKIYVDDTVWHRTGDAGRLDEWGRLYLYGRCNQVVNHNGKTIYPFLIEHAVKQLAGVRDAAFLKKGETPILAVVLAAGVPLASLHPWLHQHGLLGVTLLQVKTLPKDKRHRTKIDYKKLNEMV